MTTQIPTPKIVFFDIDDTLYIKDEDRIPDSVATAFHALKDKGIHIAIATGRGVDVFPPMLYPLIDNFGIDIIVAINGQYNIYHDTVMDFPLHPTHVHMASDCLRTHGVSFGYMTAHEIICFDHSPQMADALSSLHTAYVVKDFDEFDINTPVYQVLGFADDSIQLDLPPKLKSVRWHKYGFDILTHDVSKVRGIKTVLDRMGLSMADAVAFGDGLNDIEMLSSVGFGVAMGNAHPDLKAVADYVCPRHDEDGVLKGLVALGVI